uniref:SJCHGC05364 protein n=1 Tax=Schistosoma japonicum TaxID=6182 RepID=Q5DC22_SCHJA|nr:SJCHGC05364 protein [Schistosoma japonicum]
MTSNIATHVSTGVLGLLFILPGIVKTVRLNTTLYREMLKTFKNFTEVSPLRHIGVIPSPQIYMQSMGVFELLLGTTLIVGHVSFKKFACLGIMALMMLTTYCQVALKDYNHRTLWVLLPSQPVILPTGQA